MVVAQYEQISLLILDESAKRAGSNVDVGNGVSGTQRTNAALHLPCPRRITWRSYDPGDPFVDFARCRNAEADNLGKIETASVPCTHRDTPRSCGRTGRCAQGNERSFTAEGAGSFEAGSLKEGDVVARAGRSSSAHAAPAG
jgi:hypothetical protein